MGKATYKTTVNNLPKLIQKAQTLSNKKIEVGVFDGDHAWLAGIHEYGCKITAKSGKYLTIPLTQAAASNKAKNFLCTFVYTSKNGNKFIAWERGGKLELLFWLTKSVTIPERSFLRAGFDSCHKKVCDDWSKAVLPKYFEPYGRYDTALKQYGVQLASQIKKYARGLKEPPKSKITISVCGKRNPLIQTGEMINSITYKIEDK